MGTEEPRRLGKPGKVHGREGGDVFVALIDGGGKGGSKGKPVGARTPGGMGSTKPEEQMGDVDCLCGEGSSLGGVESLLR